MTELSDAARKLELVCGCRISHIYYSRETGSHNANECEGLTVDTCTACDVALCKECGLVNETDDGLIVVCHLDYASGMFE